MIGRPCGRGTVIEIPSERVALQTEGRAVGAWRTGGAPTAGLGARTALTCAAWTSGARPRGDPARLARAATIDRRSAVRRPSRPPPLTPFGFNLHGGWDCRRLLARAEQRCRRTLSRIDSPRLFAGVGGRRPDHHDLPHLLGSSVADWQSRRLGQPVTPSVLDRALFRAEDTYPYALFGGQVSTRKTTQEDPLLACDVIVSGLVFARQGRARTLGNG
jgi:hypothetical protein